MTSYRIVLDRALCSGFASCAASSPAAFRLDETGVAEAIVGESDDLSVLTAATSCPMGAIAVFAGSGGEQLA